MRKQTSLFLFVFVSFFQFFLSIHTLFAEKIESFDSTITLTKSDEIQVQEKIIYDSEGEEKHGIFRDIPLDTIENNPVTHRNLDLISITDENGVSDEYTESGVYTKGQSIMRYKIGDPNATFHGKKTYILTYRFPHALSKNVDGSAYLYFNITGNAWPFPIEKTHLTITRESNGPSLASESLLCFAGSFGSSQPCATDSLSVATSSSNISLAYDKAFLTGEGLTIKLPLRFEHSPFPNNNEVLFLNYGATVLFLFLSVLIVVICLKLYFLYGRDPDEGRPIVAEYSAPEGLSPLEACFLLKEKIEPRAISAQLIELGRQGFLTITAEEEKGIFSIFGGTNFYLDIIKYPPFDACEKLLKALSKTVKIELGLGASRTSLFFTSLLANISSSDDAQNTSRIAMSTATISQSEMQDIRSRVEKSLLSKNLFDSIFFHVEPKEGLQKLQTQSPLQFYVVLGIIIPSFLFIYLSIHLNSLYAFITLTTYIISGSALLRSLNRKTIAGVDIKYKLLGLKKYIEVAEEERINFHNAPQKTPDLFMKLLPWAMLFGLEKKWTKSFETVMMSESDASFYHSSTAFTAGTFASSFGEQMSSFNAVASQASVVASSGGSGSGGSSGGGGGGGGGGSW